MWFKREMAMSIEKVALVTDKLAERRRAIENRQGLLPDLAGATMVSGFT
jgi:hypothetical protein